MSLETAALIKIGTALSAASSVMSYIGARQEQSYRNEVSRRNAVIAEQNAAKAAENSQREQMDYGEAAREQIAALVAEQAASGVSIASGSPFLQSKRLRELSRRDASRLADEGRTRVEGFRQQRADFLSAAASPGPSLLGLGLDFGSTLVGGSMALKKYKGLMA